MNLYQHAKNQGISSICSGYIFDLKILQPDWLRTFCPISQETDFLQVWDLHSDTVNKINFHYTTNSEKIYWPNFSINPKEPFFGPFLGQKLFFQNIWLCHAQLHMGSNTKPKLSSKDIVVKTLDSQSRGNRFKTTEWL